MVGATCVLLATLGMAVGCGDDAAPDGPAVPAVTEGTTDVGEAVAPGTEVPEDEPAADPKSDQDQIKRTLQLVLGGSDPSLVCADLVTERYVRRSFGDAAGCRSAQTQVK